MATNGWKGDRSNIGPGVDSQSHREKKITVKREFVAALANIAHLNVKQIALVAESKELPALQVLMGKIVIDAIAGDSHARTILIDRLFGKVADAVDISHALEIDSDLAKIPIDQLVAILELQQKGTAIDVSPRPEQRAESSLPGESVEESQAGGTRIPTGLHHPTPGTTRPDSGHTSGQLGPHGEDNHGWERGYKVSSMEIRDPLLEARFTSEKYKGNPTD